MLGRIKENRTLNYVFNFTEQNRITFSQKDTKKQTMNLLQSLELKRKIKALPGFTLPLNGVKINIGNGFTAWRGPDNKERDCLFVSDKGKSQTVLWAITTRDGDGWELRNSYFKPNRLAKLIETLQTLAKDIAKEEAKETKKPEKKMPDTPTPVPKTENYEDPEDEMPELVEDPKCERCGMHHPNAIRYPKPEEKEDESDDEMPALEEPCASCGGFSGGVFICKCPKQEKKEVALPLVAMGLKDLSSEELQKGPDHFTDEQASEEEEEDDVHCWCGASLREDASCPKCD